jgi:hypothetical protein
MTRTEAAPDVNAAEIQPVIDEIAHLKDIPLRFDAKELIWS